MIGKQLVKNAKFVAGQTSPEDALSSTDYPASGSYVDVSGYETVEVIIHLGAIHASDAPKFVIEEIDGTTGTTDTIDTSLTHTAAADDDDEMIVFHIETAKLSADHHFLTTVVTGVSNGSYGDIIYLLTNPRHAPVTQTTALLPTASQNTFAG